MVVEAVFCKAWANGYIEFDISLSDSTELLVGYLSLIHQRKDDEASEYLQESNERLQDKYSVPEEFTWLGEKQDIFASEQDDEEIEVDFEFHDNSDADTDSDYAPDSMDVSSDFSIFDVSSDISMGSIGSEELTQLKADAATQLDSAYTKLAANPLLLSKGNKKEWMSVHLATRGSRMLLLERWFRALKTFFYSGPPTNNTNTVLTLGFRKLTVVCALCEMRAIPPKIYRLDSWIKQLKATGLADLIIAISDPGAFGTFEHPVVEGSFRLYDWGNSFYGLLHDWTPDTSKPDVDWPEFQPSDSPAKPIKPEEFFKILQADDTLIPTAAHPSYAFFLLSQDNFLNAWHTWLAPALNHPSRGYCSRWENLATENEMIQAIIDNTRRIRGRCKQIRDLSSEFPELSVQRMQQNVKFSHLTIWDFYPLNTDPMYWKDVVEIFIFSKTRQQAVV
ncbi:hypothetical protein HWV62_28274 [Athelia sp. TMB]|nr:hypothetical protein HWV62_28274 [Athelia sp. TMB]